MQLGTRHNWGPDCVENLPLDNCTGLDFHSTCPTKLVDIGREGVIVSTGQELIFYMCQGDVLTRAFVSTGKH